MGRLQRKKSPAKVKVKKGNKKFAGIGNTEPNGTSDIKTIPREKKRYVPLAKPVAARRDDGFFSSVFSFLKDSKLELKKVVWPSRKQTIGSTFAVILIVTLVSLFLGTIDAGLSGIIRAILR